MKIQFKMSLSFTRDKPEDDDAFEHRDTDSLVETSTPARVGFDIPTTGDDHARR